MLGVDRLLKLAEQFSAGISLVSRLRGTTQSLLELAENRLALLAVEIEAEKLRLVSLLLIGASALFFLGVGLLFGVIAIALVFWDTHREWVLGGFSFLFLLIGSLLIWLLIRRKNQPNQLFSASIAELKKDQITVAEHD